MTVDRDLDRQLGSWFDERATTSAPAGLLERSLQRVSATRQRPGWLVTDHWRSPWAMGRPATAPAWMRVAFAIAVAVALVAIGADLFLRHSPAMVEGPFSTPSTAPVPSSSVAPSPSPSPSETPAVVQPRSPSWTATGSMGTPRVEHTATLLADGRVLVVGGITVQIPPGTVLASAELYDPVSGSWTATGSMASARAGFTATLLPDGKVLVAGGYCCGTGGAGALASAELYDPVSGSWTATGSMAAPRTGHTATLLPDGKVLVAGGGAHGHGGPSWASAELYDPVTGSWTATGSMGTPRTWHSATLQPDGKVLVQGGVDSVSAGMHTLTTAELYDPGSGSWTAATGSPVSPVVGESMALLRDDRVLLLCACTSGSARLFDPSSGTWAGAGSLVPPRWGTTATLLPSGIVLVAGGTNDASALASAELFDPGSPGPSAPISPSVGPSSSVVGATPGMFAYIQSSVSSHATQLWVANTDGTGARQLAQDLGGSLGAPAWSPDGTRLVFSRAPMDSLGYPTGPSRLYLTDASGAAPQLVDTGCVAPCSGESDAAFSSDGTRLVFVRTSVGGPSTPLGLASSVLATIDLSTGRVTELASTTVSDAAGDFHGYPAANYHPRWSPDGTQIVFTQDVPSATPAPSKGWEAVGPVPAVLVVGADGQNLHRIGLPAVSADWSPDGTRIVFGSSSLVLVGPAASPGWLRQYYDIYTIRPDGTDLRRLTSDQSSLRPSWTAGGRIWFYRIPMVDGDINTAAAPSLWVMDADGNNATQLSISPQLPAAWPIAWPPQP
jgi:Tol biopolymer transport system component